MDTLEKFEIERRINMTNGTIKVYIRCSNAVGGTQCRVMCYRSQRNWTYAVRLYGPDFPMSWASAIENFIIDWFQVHVGPDDRVPQLMHTCR